MSGSRKAWKTRKDWYWIYDVVLIGGAIVGFLVLLVVLAAVTQRADYTRLAYSVRTLNLEQAEHQHQEALRMAARRFEKKPVMSISGKEFDYYLTLAILTKDRVNALKGLPNGPGVRKKWRRELTAQIRKMAQESEPL